MKRGEVCWVEFDPAIDSEISKRRPAIIISNDSANRNHTRVMVIPLTSNVSWVYPREALVKVGSQQSKAMADQMMAADKSRLKSKFAEISKPELSAVEDAIRVHLGLAM
jgi:mRNA interferase MazF